MNKLKICFKSLPFYMCMIFFCFNYSLFSPFEIIIYTIIIVVLFLSIFNIMLSLLILLDKNKEYNKW